MLHVHVVVITSDPSVRDRLRRVMAMLPDTWDVAAEHDDAASALDDLGDLQPDVVVLDDSARNDADPPIPIDRFTGDGPRRSHVLLLGKADSERLVAEALKAGVKGIMARTDGEDLLGSALDAVSRGKPFFSPGATEILLNRFLATRGSGRAAKPRTTSRNLTPREREVVRLLAEGRTTREIASALDISVKTAENHRANAMNKLGVRQISELVRRAVQDGVLS